MTKFNDEHPEYLFPDPEPLGAGPYLEWEKAFNAWEASWDPSSSVDALKQEAQPALRLSDQIRVESLWGNINARKQCR